MSHYPNPDYEEVNALIIKHYGSLPHVEAEDQAVPVLYRIIEAQAEQIDDLRADVERLADLSGLGDFL